MGALSKDTTAEHGVGSSSVSRNLEKPQTMWERFREFNTFWDSRFEDFKRDTWLQTTYRDFSAGLIVALTAIPMAMGFSMAMGLRPEQGIIAGALACVVGRTFGGSKYQVYGPTAAFIPVIAGLVRKYGEASGGTLADAHGFLVLVSIIAGGVLMGMGLLGLGKYAKLVPNSIVVGFTAGIAVAIAASNIESVLGISDFSELLDEDADIQGGFEATVSSMFQNLGKINIWAMTLGLLTFALTKILLRISIFIPAPALAIGLCTWLASTVLSGKDLILVRDLYGTIPTNFFVFTPPSLPEMSAGVAFDMFYFVAAIVFVSGVESLLCSSMADRLADNRGTPFNPNKEFWGQGLVQIITPMVNGFPCTGALARTATSIKAGAVTPFAGYFKGGLKLSLAYLIADYLEMIPMACIGGILLWVASNMIKVSEIKEVLNHNRFHALLMVYTAVMVPATDFLTGVLTSLILYFGTRDFFDKAPALSESGNKEKEKNNLSQAVTTHVTPCKYRNAIATLSLGTEDVDLIEYAKFLVQIGVITKLSFVHVAPVGDGVKNTLVEKRDKLAHLTSERLSGEFKDAIGDVILLEAHSRLEALVNYTQRQNIDLALVGHRAKTGGQRSLARRLAMESHTTVWMVPEGSAPKISGVLAPVDFSAPSADSLRQAIGVAAKADVTEVNALHVYFDQSVLRYEEHDSIVKGEELAHFERFMTGIDSQGPRVTPVFEESSNAAHAIVRQAEETGADLIVISTRGRSRAALTLLGSVASQVMAEAKTPVLAVKHFGYSVGVTDALLSGQIWNKPDSYAN
jgi:SulP family sulfate permease